MAQTDWIREASNPGIDRNRLVGQTRPLPPPGNMTPRPTLIP